MYFTERRTHTECCRVLYNCSSKNSVVPYLLGHHVLVNKIVCLGAGSLDPDTHHPEQRGISHQRCVQVRGLGRASEVLHGLENNPPPDRG